MNPTGAWSLMQSILRSLAFVALATAAAWVMDGAYSLASQAMAYLLAVVFAAFRYGRRDSALTAVAGVVALNFFFVPPRYTLNVANADYGVTLLGLLLVSFVVSGLAMRLKAETANARLREQRARELHALADSLAAAGDRADLLRRGQAVLDRAFGEGVLLLPDESRSLRVPDGAAARIDANAARWVFEQCQPIGPHTNRWPELPRWYAPLPGDAAALGVASVPAREGSEEDLRHFETVARQIGFALQREHLARRAREAALEVQAESLRNALLASISHDMRTPLAAILGSATTLSDQHDRLTESQQRELLRSIGDEAMRMTTTAENILQLARLSSDKVELRRDWQSVAEIIGTEVGRQQRRGRRNITAAVDAGLPLVRADAVLLDQVLANLIDNAIRHAGAGMPVEVSASAIPGEIRIAVEDRGPGLGTGDPALLFAKFQRGAESRGGGAGLGLAICKAIVELHGGRIEARNRSGGGAAISFTLPVPLVPPVSATESP